MGYAGRLDRPHLLEFEIAHVLEQPLAVTEQDRDDVELELIDQPGGEVLLYDVGVATDQDISAAPGLPRLFERGLDSIGDEDERWCLPPSPEPHDDGG